MKRGLARIASLLIVGFLIGAGVAGLQIKNEVGSQNRVDKSYIDETMKGAKIGGPFELVNHDGEVVTEKSWPAQYLLIFFGFTHCPDICPLNMNIITQALNNADNEIVDHVQPLMITIDPDRDDALAMKEYMSLFHSKFVGLTGTHEQIKVATAAYRVYEQKVLFDEAGKDPNDYTMNHSSFTYLMSPEGKLLDVFAHDTPPDEVMAALEKFVN